MAIVHLATPGHDDERRARLYRGEIFAFPHSLEGEALCALARSMAEDAFHPLDPRTAQHELPVERFAAILGELKPSFIHHPDAKRLIVALLAAYGCDLEQTHFDVPRLRTSTSHGYLTTGIAYAFHPHRDTWYSAPTCQLNWWLPVYPLGPGDGMAFYPDYFDRAVLNSSSVYDYEEWNHTNRYTATRHIGRDTRPQPFPQVPIDTRAELRLVGEVGSVLLFSGGHLHASVENLTGATRLSVDFRTVHREDAKIGRGAPNLDIACTSSSIGDFRRASDGEPLPRELVERYLRGDAR